jgi:selenocysteine lyase/cysteine desulfurase
MNLTEQFPIISTSTYLNTASSGILSKSLLDWRRSHDTDFYHQGSTFRMQQAEFLNDVKCTVARFFKISPDNTFLVPNFSFGFNTFLEGLSGNQKFLLVRDDYPSINYAVQSRGFTCEYVQADEHFEENIYSAIKTLKPTIFAFSIVQYISGIKINIDFLKTLKASFPDLLIVADGTQFCGTESFDFLNSGIDVLMSSGYKWMLAGYGNGFMLLKDQAKDQLYQDAKARSLPQEPFLQGKSVLSIYFEPGHQDTLAFGSLKHSISFLEELDMAVIKQKIEHLSQIAKEAFLSRDLLRKVVATRNNHTSIFNLSVPERLYEKLQTANVLSTSRGNGIRIAFNFYNSEQDLKRLLEVIDQNR